MRIEINNSPAGPWGRIGIDAASTAMSVLGGDAFKAWVKLALNQDGYAWHGELEPTVTEALADCGYLFPLSNDEYVFDTGGEAALEEPPELWKQISGLYGSTDIQHDYRYVVGKLDSLALSNKENDILSYWLKKYKDLQKTDHSKAKNRLKYDLSVVLAWWVRDHFRFQAGDVLHVGIGGRRLRFRDEDLKAKVQRYLGEKTETLTLGEESAKTWNKYLRCGGFEIRLQDIATILRRRHLDDL